MSETLPSVEAADLTAAYGEALAKGEKEVHRGRINFYGYLKAGKTSLFRRLLGKQFDKNIQRTEGIDIHTVKIKKEEWIEDFLAAENLDEQFSEVVVSVQERLKRRESQQPDNREVPESNQTIHLQKSAAVAETQMNGVTAGHIDVKCVQEGDKETTSLGANFNETQQSKRKRPHEIDKDVEEETIKESRIDKQTHETIQRLVIYRDRSLKREKIDTDNKEEYLLFVWDFGGQTGYYATHHLFLETKAAHLIVMDVTKKFHEPVNYSYTHMIKSTPTTPKEFLHYWLASVHTKSSKGGNVAVFLTHTDEVDKQICKKYIQKYKSGILNSLDGSRRQAV